MVDLSKLERVLGAGGAGEAGRAGDTARAGGLIRDPRACEAAGTDWRGLYRGPVLAIARPACVREAAGVVAWAASQSPPVALVAQGGNTSLAGGAVPTASGLPALILSSQRLNRIRHLDAPGRVLIAEAGVILETAKQAVAPLEMPVDLAARGSAQIGGLLASHAGGLNVVRYGNLRGHVLGVEAVLPDGQIWHGLKTVAKDNSGYDLKSLLIGAEGTLGFITAAAIRLAPPIAERSVFLVGLEMVEEAVETFQHLERQFYGQILAAELMPRAGVERGLRAGTITANPFPAPLQPLQPWLLLLEIAHRPGLIDAEIALAQTALASKFHVIQGQSSAQNTALWQVREGMQRAQGHFGASIKHDVCVPLAHVPALLRDGTALARQIVPGCVPVPFGHLGDGSFHFNISAPETMGESEFRSYTKALNRALHDLVDRLGGSMSAEHGLGQYRRAEAHRLRDPAASAAMAKIKGALDPLHIFNPGKFLET